MSDADRRSWEDAIDALRRAANEVRSAAGRTTEPSAEEDAAAARLKADVSRLERSAFDLREKLASSLGQQRQDLEASVDREQARQSADQIRDSLEELASVAGKLTSDIAATAGVSLEQAEPELKSAVRALEDVAGSAAAWVRAVVDPPGGSKQGGTTEARPPLDET